MKGRTSTPVAIADNSTRVVVLGTTHHCSLEIMRSLGRLGIAVFAVDEGRWAPAFHSRYCQGRTVWDLGNAPPEKSVERLAEIARSAGRKCVLMPTTDLAAIFVADQAAALSEWFLFPSQTSTLIRSLCSKKKMYDLARKHGIATPITLWPENGLDLRNLLDSLDVPLIVKATVTSKSPEAKQNSSAVRDVN